MEVQPESSLAAAALQRAAETLANSWVLAPKPTKSFVKAVTAAHSLEAHLQSHAAKDAWLRKTRAFSEA